MGNKPTATAATAAALPLPSTTMPRAPKLKNPPTKRKTLAASRKIQSKETKKPKVDTPTRTPTTDGVVVDENQNEGTYYEVAQIVGRRKNNKNRRIEYKIRWKNCSPDQDTWEPAKNLCDSALQDAKTYDEEHGFANKRGRPAKKNKNKTPAKKKKKTTTTATEESKDDGEEKKEEDMVDEAAEEEEDDDEATASTPAKILSPAVATTSSKKDGEETVDDTNE
jgi:hypothetical protein